VTGALVIRRKVFGRIRTLVKLLQTLPRNAVMAIENARLFQGKPGEE